MMTQSRTISTAPPSNSDIDPDSSSTTDDVRREGSLCVHCGANIGVNRVEKLHTGEIALSIVCGALLIAIFVSATYSSLHGLSTCSSIYSITVGYGMSLSMTGTYDACSLNQLFDECARLSNRTFNVP
jgi:hypothetical protein